MKNTYTFIDLFSGCGGLSEGFYMQGLHGLAHVEWETPMVDTLRNRLIKKWGHSQAEAEAAVVHFDIQKTDELISGDWSDETLELYGKTNASIVAQHGLDGLVGERNVDLIIGGPPCQAYSIAGRAQDPNSMRDDYRNYLFESFVKVVDYYRPKVFVFENVPGILSAKPGDRYVKDRIYEAFDKIGYEIRTPEKMKKSIYSSSDFQVPQERHRVIIFGVEKGGAYKLEDFYDSLNSVKSTAPVKTVRDAIGDMPKFMPLDKPYKDGARNVSHGLLGTKVVPQHEARYHNPRDIEIFRKWISESMNDIPNEEKLAFYKKVSGKTSNHNKYRSLEWGKPSPSMESFARIRIPNNMFIWATMNSADQGVFPMDTAFKRRWSFEYKGIDENEDKVGGKIVLGVGEHEFEVDWNVLRKAINEVLAKKFNINEDKLMGPFFMSEDVFAFGEDGFIKNPEKFKKVFKSKVIMYLYEDAAKQQKHKLFSGCDSTKYSSICDAFDNIGIDVFGVDFKDTYNDLR